METILITGSTGFIGMELAKTLAARGHRLHLLVRSPEKAKSLLRDGVTLYRGDITDIDSLEAAMIGTTYVFHLAALAKQVSDDPADFEHINVEGTRNVLECALRHNIRKVVYTSTAGVFGTTGPDEEADENRKKPDSYTTEYERTKKISEEICMEYGTKGLDISLTYPTRVFGPGVITESNAVTKIISLYIRGKWRIIPGDGHTFGNYVFVEDVVNGLILAMENGGNGEGYILGGHNVTFNELFRAIRSCSEQKYRLIHIPYPILWLAGAVLMTVSKLTHTPPLITPAWVRRYLLHRRLSSAKAINDLGYRITPLNEGITRTIEWLKHQTL